MGIIQGVLEWLPVSSQGNLTIIMIGIFNTSVEVAARFSVALHAGTLMAAVVYFRRVCIAARPTKKENNIPKAASSSDIPAKLVVPEIPTSAARTAGMLIMNDSLRESFPPYPRRRRKDVVIPEREIPGITASPCTSPRRIESLKFILPLFA